MKKLYTGVEYRNKGGAIMVNLGLNGSLTGEHWRSADGMRAGNPRTWSRRFRDKISPRYNATHAGYWQDFLLYWISHFTDERTQTLNQRGRWWLRRCAPFLNVPPDTKLIESRQKAISQFVNIVTLVMELQVYGEWSYFDDLGRFILRVSPQPMFDLGRYVHPGSGEYDPFLPKDFTARAQARYDGWRGEQALREQKGESIQYHQSADDGWDEQYDGFLVKEGEPVPAPQRPSLRLIKNKANRPKGDPDDQPPPRAA